MNVCLQQVPGCAPPVAVAAEAVRVQLRAGLRGRRLRRRQQTDPAVPGPSTHLLTCLLNLNGTMLATDIFIPFLEELMGRQHGALPAAGDERRHRRGMHSLFVH